MNGIIIIDKPAGLSSRQVVSKVSKIVNEKKAGHTGTLDPMATGVLPILLGKATKLSKYLIEHDKKYITTIYLGEKKNTGDIEGEIIEKKEVPVLNDEIIQNVLKEFTGTINQIPPMYSAIKHEGKKLYEYARQGIEIKRNPREITIYELNLINYDNNRITLEVYCSKGTYIRVLCEDIAEKLNTVGYMESLRRTEVDRFKISNSVKIEELSENQNNIITIEEYFSLNDKIVLNERKQELFLNGVKLTFDLNDGIYRVYTNNSNFIGLGVVDNKLLKRDIVI